MPSPNTNIISLTRNNTVSEMMLKINELVYERNLNTMTNPMSVDVAFESSIHVNNDIFVGESNHSVVSHMANNYAHGVVVENLSYNSNTGILHLVYNDLSYLDITLDISLQNNVVFGDIAANNVVAENLFVNSNNIVVNLNAEFLKGKSTDFFAANADLVIHASNTSNPHGVTAQQIGLGNVTNESKDTLFNDPSFTGTISIDSNNLISNLNAEFLNGNSSDFYASNTNLDLHIGDTTNPHQVTAEQVGLGSVTNESKDTLFNDPSFTGNVSAPTPDASSSNTQIATTEFVQNKINEIEEYALFLAILLS